MKLNFLWIAAVTLTLFTQSCRSKQAPQAGTTNSPIEQAILNDSASFYYVNFAHYPSADASLPIGVFDSGTGGLTVLDAVVTFDENNNESKAIGKDGKPDFAQEKFIYLADQANMPYGNYYSENKSDLLVEHILKDAQFLLSNKYYPDAAAKQYRQDKQPVKAIVIACNTATAYGKKNIDSLIKKAGINVPVIGVIDAGARGALAVFSKEESGSIGVFATVGTIASKGYENAITSIKNAQGYSGDIQIYNQGGYGVAEAVDEEPDFIDHKTNSPRTSYRGPSLNNKDYRIDKALMDIYNFDFSNSKTLCDSKTTDDCNVLQLNSTDSYVRYHLVSLMEQLRKANGAQPLKVLVLGCTHYPYLTNSIRTVLNELYSYRKNGNYYYRSVMNENIHIINPAENVAIELHAYLNDHKLFNPSESMDNSEFYISVPNTDNQNVKVDEQGRFTYEYKYGRNAGEIQEYVKVVPFSKQNIPLETLKRLEKSILNTYKLIVGFDCSSPKTTNLPEADRIN